mmetsp:Transcript_40898/g.46465  ORF Transcript_40898/g.46465 Transcript_40898/m.46465 type:complete len:128 (+) Transcript_40898:39-422(+)
MDLFDLYDLLQVFRKSHASHHGFPRGGNFGKRRRRLYSLALYTIQYILAGSPEDGGAISDDYRHKRQRRTDTSATGRKGECFRRSFAIFVRTTRGKGVKEKHRDGFTRMAAILEDNIRIHLQLLLWV